MKRITISVFSSGVLLTALSAASFAQFQLGPITPLPTPQLPGIKAPPMLPVPIEQPTWPKIEIYVAPSLNPTIPLPLSPVAPSAARLAPAQGRPVQAVAPVLLPAPARPLAAADQSRSRLPAQQGPAAVRPIKDAREAFRLRGRDSRPSSQSLHAVFDGLRSAQPAGAVDTRPSEQPEEDEVEGEPAEQPLPWMEPSRPVTLPEWDLEREIGLR